MSANKELDELQNRGEAVSVWKNGWVAITANGNKRNTSRIFDSQDEAREATKWNVGHVTLCPIRYRIK